MQDALKTTGARTIYVNVFVSGGIIHLWGMAYTEDEKQVMCVAAEGVRGAREIRERISILPRGAGGMR